MRRRTSSFEVPWTVTLVLVVINVVVFVAQNAVDASEVNPQLALTLQGFKSGHVWQLITFQFMHAPLRSGGIFHLLGNCFTIYVFGHAVEEAMGKSGFLKLYLLSGAVGGAFQMVGGLFWPQHFGEVLVGASAGALGLVAAFAALFPHRPIGLFFLPIEVRARVVLWVCLGVSVVGLFFHGPVAHGAHLGGMLTGFLYIHFVTNSQTPLIVWPPSRTRKRPRELVSVRSRKPSVWQGPKPGEPVELPPGDFISKEVDPILDKISAHGIQSLTERERQILEAARARMSRRK